MSISRIKPKHRRAVRTTISLQPVVYDAALEIVRKWGFGGLSDYIGAHIRRDAGLDDFMVPGPTSEK